MLRVQESQFLQFSSFFLAFYCSCFVWVPGGASGGLLELLGASRGPKNSSGSNVKGSGISISVIFFISLVCLFGCLGELLGASLSFWEPPGSKKLFRGLMLRVQESQFLQFSSFFLVFYCFCFVWVPGELLGASLSFWEPPRSPKTGISFFVWLFLIVFLLGALESFWNKWVRSEGLRKAAYDQE